MPDINGVDPFYRVNDDNKMIELNNNQLEESYKKLSISYFLAGMLLGIIIMVGLLIIIRH